MVSTPRFARMPDRFGGARPVALGLVALMSLACADATGPEGSPCDVVTRRGAAQLSLSLAPGEMCTVPVDDLVSIEVESGATSAQYLIVVQSGFRSPGARTRLRLSARGRAATAAQVPALSSAPRLVSTAGRRLEAASSAELTLRASARRALLGARPLNATRPRAPLPAEWASGAESRGATRPPVAGDTVVFHNAVDPDLGVDCAGIHDVTAVVRDVGRNFAVAEDVEGSGWVSDTEYRTVIQALENAVFPVVTAYFGEPADLDGNGVIWVLFTPVVNRTTSRSSTTRISGFFNPADLADPESCAASNGGELLWLLAADPNGRYSRPVPESYATTRAIGVAAHELEHLISAERRTVLEGGSFADLEAVWLSEGLAHSAETFVGMSLGGLRPGGNYGFDELVARPETFDTFLFPNLRRAAYYLTDPHRTPALGNEAGRDPSGLPSLAMRGFGWLLLRWFADQYAVGAGGLLGGPPEETIFRDLAGGGPGRARGVENLERVAASVGAPGDWEALLATWALAPIADDRQGEIPLSTQVTSLHLRDAFSGLHRGLEDEEPFDREFPLLTTDIALAADTDVRVDFELNAATGRYFVLESDGPHPPLRVRLTTPTGGRLPGSAGVRFVVLRTR